MAIIQPIVASEVLLGLTMVVNYNSKM